MELERKRKAMEAQIAAVRAEFLAEAATIERTIKQDKLRESQLQMDRSTMARSRNAGSSGWRPTRKANAGEIP